MTFAYHEGMNFKISLFVIASLSIGSVFVGCASAPPVVARSSAPDWVSHPSDSYPQTRYLTSVGSGNSRNDAIEDAKKQMAESFVVKVQSETNALNQSNMASSTSGSMNGDVSHHTQNKISLNTDTYLRGAEVKEIAQVGSQFYALVALDKLQARSGLVLEANRIQSKLSPMVDQLESNYNTKQMTAAREELGNLEELYGEASALGMSALVDVSSFESRLAKVDAAARASGQKQSFTVKMLAGDERFSRDIEACINDHGGVVYDPNKAPTDANRVEVTIIERPQAMQIEGWNKIRFDLTAAVIDANGKLYRIQATETETAKGEDAVFEAVSDKLSKDFCENLFSRMSEVK
jgi:hypothetical protein